MSFVGELIASFPFLLIIGLVITTVLMDHRRTITVGFAALQLVWYGVILRRFALESALDPYTYSAPLIVALLLWLIPMLFFANWIDTSGHWRADDPVVSFVGWALACTLPVPIMLAAFWGATNPAS